MNRKRLFPLVLLTLALPSSLWAQLTQRSLDHPTRSTTENLAAKRYVAAGDRTYIVGTQDGNFPGMGFHITDHVNGVWAHPLKLLDYTPSTSMVPRFRPRQSSLRDPALLSWITRQSPVVGKSRGRSLRQTANPWR
jgi:hypothetical protein